MKLKTNFVRFYRSQHARKRENNKSITFWLNENEFQLYLFGGYNRTERQVGKGIRRKCPLLAVKNVVEILIYYTYFNTTTTLVCETLKIFLNICVAEVFANRASMFAYNLSKTFCAGNRQRKILCSLSLAWCIWHLMKVEKVCEVWNYPRTLQ